MHWNCAHRERSFWPRFFSAAAAQALRSAVPLSYLRSSGFLLLRAAKLLCIRRGGGFHILCG